MTLTFNLVKCQPELVEGEFNYGDQLRQAQLDTSIVSNFYNLKFLNFNYFEKYLKYLLQIRLFFFYFRFSSRIYKYIAQTVH
jgi:hypothetical protein